MIAIPTVFGMNGARKPRGSRKFALAPTAGGDFVRAGQTISTAPRPAARRPARDGAKPFVRTEAGTAVTHLAMGPLRPTPNYRAAASASDGQSGDEWRCRHREAKAVQVVDSLLRMGTRNLGRPTYVVVYEPLDEEVCLISEILTIVKIVALIFFGSVTSSLH
jgi:hypothetical protein